MKALETVEKSKGGRGLVGSALSVSGFAKRLGKSQGYITETVQGAEVYKLIAQAISFEPCGRLKHLTAIHSAPSPTWPTLAALLQDHDWSVKDTKAAVERIKSVAESLPDLAELDDRAPVNLFTLNTTASPRITSPSNSIHPEARR